MFHMPLLSYSSVTIIVHSFVLYIVTGTGKRYPKDKDREFEILMLIDS
jgi:hypothetical protein